jgi:hypothetical protein
MRGHGHSSSQSNNTPKTSSKQWGQPPKVPPRDPPQSGRTSSSQNYATPPKTRAAYTDFRQGTTPNASPRRSDSMGGRKGFMPNTPGGDEPAAPRGAYFTTTRAAAEPPPVPPRNPSPIPPPAPATNADADLLNQFRESIPKYQPRTSTPYSTHGGEKFNPFESANIGRSKSTREPEHPRHVPRAAGSDPNLGSPHRTETFAGRQAKGSNRSPVEISSDDDSNSSLENGPALSGRPFGRRRVSKNVRNGARPTAQPQQVPKAAESSPQTRKHLTNLDKFRQWMKENPGREPPLNGFPPDGPPLRYDATQTDKPDEAKMYDHSQSFSNSTGNPKADTPIRSSTLPKSHTANFKTAGFRYKYPHLFPDGTEPTMSPSGGSVDPQSLNAFEGIQRNVIDHLLSSKRKSSGSNPRQVTPEKRASPREEDSKTKDASAASQNIRRSSTSIRINIPKMETCEKPDTSSQGSRHGFGYGYPNSSQHRNSTER